MKEKAEAHASAFLLAESMGPVKYMPAIGGPGQTHVMRAVPLLPAQRGEGGRRPDEGRSSHNHQNSTREQPLTLIRYASIAAPPIIGFAFNPPRAMRAVQQGNRTDDT
jgi:hypothetical protein